jgi:phosphatidate phosphatase LPIN
LTDSTVVPGGRATPSSSTLDSSAIKQEIQEAADPHIFVVISEGRKHVFELATCHPSSESSRAHAADEATAYVALPSQDEFTNNRLSKEEFLKSSEKVEDRNLYVRYNEQVFGWDNGSAALASMALYRKALIDRQAKAPVAPLAKQGTWKRWWGGSRSRTITGETNGSATSSVSLASQLPPSQDSESNGLLEVHRSMERASSEPAPSSSPPTSPPLPTSPTLSQTDTVHEKDTADGVAPDHTKPIHYAKTLRLTSDQLKQLKLKKGRNDISFTVQSSFSGVARITARVFLWEADYRIVISDIDGTITK